MEEEEGEDEGGEDEGEGEGEGEGEEGDGSHRGQVQVRDPAQAHLDPLGFQDLPHRHDHQVHALAWPEPLGAGRRQNITTKLQTLLQSSQLESEPRESFH